jgi:large subunit ribosomal protein L17
MRHRVKGSKLSRTGAHRRALARNLAAALIEHERIETTLVKAKEHRPFVERLVTLAKVKNLHNYRRALALLGNNEGAAAKLFEVLGPRFASRPGGYTRILKLQKPRLGDQARRALFEFVERTPKAAPPATEEAAAAAPGRKGRRAAAAAP